MRHILTSGIAAALLVTAPASLCAQLSLADRAAQTGTLEPSFGRGSAMIDVDGDGLLDIITGNASMPNGFFRQRPDHTFEDASVPWGIAFDDRATWGVLVTDFDNDGDPDVYFINGGFVGAPQANQFLRNDLNTLGGLTDVSAASGSAALLSKNFGGTAFDYDLDGDLDIFLTTTNDTEPCILLRNDGNLVFTDVSAAARLVDLGGFRHCSMGDFDNDGWMDVAVGNQRGANVLYRNKGDGTFTNVAATAGVQSPLDNFGLVLEDFDNDGWMDLFAPKMQKNAPTGPSPLFRNNGDGTFTDVTAGSGMTGQADMGHNTADIDADGYPDIYIGTGTPDIPFFDVLFLITPNGAGGFTATDASVSSGITSIGLTRCHGITFGDYDQDGDLDVYTNNGGVPTLPQTLQENALWQNQGNTNRWTALHLTGVFSNRSAVGARCVATTSAGRQIYRLLRAGNGFANTDSPIQRFGIGQDDHVVRIEIHWPNGITRTILNPPMGQVNDVVEILPGDMNHDNVVDVQDTGLFIAVLLGADNDPYRLVAADANASGLVEGGDIQAFINTLVLP